MDFVDRVSAWASGARPSRGAPSFAKLLEFTPLSSRVQQHLAQVYVTLAAALGVAAAGVYLSILTGFGTGLGFLGFLISCPWLMSTPATPANLPKRRALLGAAALSQGLLLGPMVNAALTVHPAALLTALGGTAAVFASFSAAALLSPRRQYLYLGGLLSSVLSTLFIVRLTTSVFGGAALLWQAEIYVGLAVFSGYVVFDTQVIVERCEAGTPDVLRDALDLFVDAIAIFVRLLVILMRQAEQKERRERERQAGRPAGGAASAGPRRRDARTTRL